MPGTLTIGGLSAGLPGGENVIGPVTTTGLNTVGERLSGITLNSGDNTFAIPSGSSVVAVFLPSGTTATVRVRTNLNSADGGTYIAPAVANLPWFKKDLVSGETSVIINANASVALAEIDFI
jgi:hypothetical protein